MRTRRTGRIAVLIRRINETSAETKSHAASIAVILALTIVFFAPVAFGHTFSMVGAHMFAQYPWIGVIKNSPEVRGRGFPHTDHAEAFYPTTMFATNAVRGGQLPMWLPYSFSGIPVMEVGVSYGLVYPPRLLLAAVLSPVRQHDFLLFTHLLLAGVGMYVLLRAWKASALGAVFGAIVWEMSGHNTIFLIFEQLAIATAWFPVMMLGATLAIRKQSAGWAVIAGAAMGMSILGNLYFAYVSAWILSPMYLVIALLAARKLLLKGQRRQALFCLFLPLVSAAVAAALGAASWIAFLEAFSGAHRGSEPLEAQLALGVPLRSLLRALILPTSAAGLSAKIIEFAAFAYVGTPALIFILIGFLRRSAPALLATALGLISLGIIMGFSPLISFLRLVLPGFGAMHIHVGYFPLCVALTVLAAFGLTDARRRLRIDSSQWRLESTFGLCLIAVQAVQLILFAWIVNPTQPARSEWFFPETALITSLKAQQGEFHILPIYMHLPGGQWTPPMFAGKVAAGFDLRSSSGYESLLPESTALLWHTVEMGGKPVQEAPRGYRPYFFSDRLPIALLKNLSVGLLATPPNTSLRDVDGSDPVAGGVAQLTYRGPDGDIYKLDNALPRAFLAPRVLTAPDAPTALAMLTDKKFDARKTAIVIDATTAAQTGLPASDQPASDASSDQLEASATIVKDRLNEVEIQTVSQRPAMLVLNDSWNQSWKVMVDGVERPIVRVNYGFRGVVVSEGAHRVAFLYRPTLLLVVMAISGGTLLLLLVACVWLGIFWLRRFYRSTLPHF